MVTGTLVISRNDSPSKTHRFKNIFLTHLIEFAQFIIEAEVMPAHKNLKYGRYNTFIYTLYYNR